MIDPDREPHPMDYGRFDYETFDRDWRAWDQRRRRQLLGVDRLRGEVLAGIVKKDSTTTHPTGGE